MMTNAPLKFHLPARRFSQSTALPVRQIVLAALVTFCVFGLPFVSFAEIIDFSDGNDYDNTPNTVTNPGAVQHLNQVTGKFRDVFWWSTRNSAVGVDSPDYINRGNSLVLSGNHAVFGPGPYTALNFTGNAPSGGQSYMSVYDTTPGNVSPKNVFDFSVPGGQTISADVLFAHNGHSVSGGLVALYDEGQSALAFLAHQGGGNNPDHDRVQLVFQANGVGTNLAEFNLNTLPEYPSGTAFVNARWYQLTMNVQVTGNTVNVDGKVYNHSDPTNPNSSLGTLIHNLVYSGPLAANNLTNPGEIGVMAQANQGFGDGIPNPLLPTVDNVGVSITNFDPGIIPEPATISLLVLAGVGLSLRRSAR